MSAAIASTSAFVFFRTRFNCLIRRSIAASRNDGGLSLICGCFKGFGSSRTLGSKTLFFEGSFDAPGEIAGPLFFLEGRAGTVEAAFLATVSAAAVSATGSLGAAATSLSDTGSCRFSAVSGADAFDGRGWAAASAVLTTAASSRLISDCATLSAAAIWTLAESSSRAT